MKSIKDMDLGIYINSNEDEIEKLHGLIKSLSEICYKIDETIRELKSVDDNLDFKPFLNLRATILSDLKEKHNRYLELVKSSMSMVSPLDNEVMMQNLTISHILSKNINFDYKDINKGLLEYGCMPAKLDLSMPKFHINKR